jgi:tRNA 5-methylaminomethyl-2-thiouridine biosynthesis bifunctional protein
MPNPICPARLEYRDGVPYSVAPGDIHAAIDDGAWQARNLLLRACGLPQAWAGRAAVVVGVTRVGRGRDLVTASRTRCVFPSGRAARTKAPAATR